MCFVSKGLDEEGKDETLLGAFTYAVQEELIQTFPLQVQCSRVYPRTHFLGPASLRFPELSLLLSEARHLICRGTGVLCCEGGGREEGRSCHLSQCRGWSWSRTWLAEEDGQEPAVAPGIPGMTLLFATGSLQDEKKDFQFLKLVVQSNWGKPGYTCIYRVQVHAKTGGTSAISQISDVRNLLH